MIIFQINIYFEINFAIFPAFHLLLNSIYHLPQIMEDQDYMLEYVYLRDYGVHLDVLYWDMFY